MNIKEAIEWYCEYDENRGYEERRYPACVAELNGVVAIADEDGENGSSLEMYPADVFIEWMEKAREMFNADEDIWLSDCLYETAPECDVRLGH